MYYKRGVASIRNYVPDFVAETADYVLMIETKSTQHQNQDGSWNEEVTEKARSGVNVEMVVVMPVNTLHSTVAQPWKYFTHSA